MKRMPPRLQLVTILALALPGAVLCCATRTRGQNKGVVAAENAPEDERQAQIDAQAQQYVQFMQPLMWRELDFVRQVCEVAPEQRPRIKAAGEAGVKQAARDMVSPRLLGGSRSPATAGQTIRDGIAKELEQALSVEQLSRYIAEAARRKEADKEAAIASAVAQLDTALFLTQEQREKIVQAIDANWQDGWEQWLMMWQYAGQYYPEIPDQHVTPHLTDEQKSVWRGLVKVGINSWGGSDGRQPADDEWWEGKPAAGKAKAKAKAKAKGAEAAP